MSAVIQTFGGGKIRRAPALGLLVCLLSLFFAVGVARSQSPSQLFRFPPGNESGETGGLLSSPTAIAASPVTGHVYVAESGNARISEFTSGGDFVRAWGWGVVASGPGNEPQNEIQEIDVSATGGSFDLVFSNPFSDGGSVKQQTGAISFDVSAAAVQAALEALESPVPGDISVSGPAGGPWTIEFIGKYADTDIAPLEIANSTLVGTATVLTAQGGANFEICEASEGDVCRAGQRGGFAPGELQGALAGLATGPDGSIFVLEEDVNSGNARIQKFQPDGEFELMFGGEVNKTTSGNICTQAEVEAGAECGRGIPGTGPGQISVNPLAFLPSRLAFGPNDTLYVGDENRVSEFESDGSFKGDIATTGYVKNLTVDAAGNLYLSYFEKNDVFKLTAAGAPASPASFPLIGPNTLALDPDGNLYVIQDPPGGGQALQPRVVKFGPTGTKLVPTPDEEAENVQFAANNPSGLATLLCPAGEDLGALYVSDFSGHVTAYGSDPGCGESPPKITDRYVASAGSEEATIGTRINPNGNPATYYVEYGTSPCETSTCTQVPAAPGKDLEDEGSSSVLREIQLTGLSLDTTYFYQVVVIGGVGGSLTEESEEGTFTTRRPGTGPLPDGRAFEMVSPVNKNSADIAPRGGLGNDLMQAAESGPGIVYPSPTPFEEPEGAPYFTAYLGIREIGPQWSTQNISPQGAPEGVEQQVKALSADLRTAAVISSEPPLCCGATNGIENLYLRDLDTGAYTLVSEEEPQLTVTKAEYCVGLQGFTPDFSRVFFKANGALTDDAPAGSGWNLYEWTAAEGISLTSVLPGETPATPGNSTSFGRSSLFCNAERIVDDAISADGTKAIWTSGSALYARVNGTETVQLDLPQGGPGSAGTGTYWAASEDASKVFFTASSLLTAPNAHAGDLYRYDFDQSLGSRLTNITAGPNTANVQGVVGASEAGDAVYFVATGVLAANEGAAVDDKGDPQKAKGGQNNLYLWRAGEGTRFIAQLSPMGNAADPASDLSNWEAAPNARKASVTADANTLAFTSIEPLTGYDSTSQADGEPTRQVYLYDAGSDELTCASCNPTGQRPLGPEDPWESSSEQPGLFTWKTAFSEPRYLSEDGNRLFFESLDALVSEDQNERRDVYELERPGKGDCTTASPSYWESLDACLDLISSGTGADNFFLDASATGDEVFISTAERLAHIDIDEKYDAYGVRVGGETQIKPPIPPPCDEILIPCPKDKQPVPEVTPPKSNPPLGEGNPPIKTCPKGKVKRGGKCVPKPCPKGKVRRKGKCVKKSKAAKQKQGQRQGGSGK